MTYTIRRCRCLRTCTPKKRSECDAGSSPQSAAFAYNSCSNASHSPDSNSAVLSSAQHRSCEHVTRNIAAGNDDASDDDSERQLTVDEFDAGDDPRDDERGISRRRPSGPEDTVLLAGSNQSPCVHEADAQHVPVEFPCDNHASVHPYTMPADFHVR